MNILKIALILLFILLTAGAIIIRPEMHSPVLIEDSEFELTEEVTMQNFSKLPAKQASQVPKSIQTKEQPQKQIVKIIRQPIVEQTVTRNSPIVPQKEKVTVGHTKSQSTVVKLLENTENIQKEQPKTAKKSEIPKIEKKVIQEEVKPLKNPYMTEQEEIIAWNRWRSSIQNKIMRDSDIDFAPLGTMFSFTFVVDKFGNVSNIKVECSNPSFMNVARNNVKPAISRLQRQPILNFPRGTQRASTVVTGVFAIGTRERYSSPSDYSDYERVVY